MTELTWDGKYKDGKKVAPVRIALPFQTIESVNESAQQRQKMLDLFSSGRDPEWRNRLIWGDKKYVLPSLLPDFAGKVNLIYIDPPFDTGADFSFRATVPDNPETEEDENTEFLKEPSIIEQKAYRDTWGAGLDSYLQWFYETALLFHELLNETGSLYVHLDWHVSSHVRVVLDEVFGLGNFRNEIVWKRSNPKSLVTINFATCTDVILYYVKSDKYTYNQPYEKHDPEYVESAYKYHDEKGRYRLLPLLNPSDNRPNLTYEFLGVTRVWRWTKDRMKKAYEEGTVVQLKPGAVPQYKKYLHESKGRTISNCWTDIPQAAGNEAVGYPTQKPEMLLERIIKTSSNEGDLVLDCFCGGGTTSAVAEKLRRRWIACDLGRFSVQTTRKRLLSIENVRPFVVQNLGKYERQAWQSEEFAAIEDQREKELKYRKFVLELYKADTITGYAWLHGVKNGRMVYVGSVDAPVTLSDIKAISAEVWKSVGKGKGSAEKAAVDILGWDFALEVNEVAKQVAAESKVDVAFKVIPKEILDKKAVEQGDIRFFELASLSVDVEKKWVEIKAKLADFVIPPQDVPVDVQKSITHWSQWVDYWAIDWDYKNDTFHNEWQSYRTRQDSKLRLEAAHVYKEPGEYKVVVKVIDILGNDTTKMINVQVSGAQSKKQKAEATSRR